MKKNYFTNFKDFEDYAMAMGEEMKLSYLYLLQILDVGCGEVTILDKAYKPSEILLKVDPDRFWGLFRQVTEENLHNINSYDCIIDAEGEELDAVLSEIKAKAYEKSKEAKA